MLLFGDNLDVQTILTVLLAVLIGMTIHEFAHNYVGHRMGDYMPSRMGKLTLNPLAHINPLGFLMFALIGFGILGQAPIAEHRMRDRRWGYLAAVAAGPFSNLLLAAVSAVVFRLLLRPGVPDVLQLFFYQLVFWNVLLFVFNLLPFFPIDGWQIVRKLLPPDLQYTWERYAQTTQYILLGLILLGFLRIPGLNILGTLIYQPTLAILGFLIGL